MSLKPGGPEPWKLMHDDGVFDWLDSRGREGGIVRQITNPMAGTDTTLLSLSGVGVKGNKSLGFASCERHIGASEGVNVLIEKRNDWTASTHTECRISNTPKWRVSVWTTNPAIRTATRARIQLIRTCSSSV